MVVMASLAWACLQDLLYHKNPCNKRNIPSIIQEIRVIAEVRVSEERVMIGCVIRDSCCVHVTRLSSQEGGSRQAVGA